MKFKRLGMQPLCSSCSARAAANHLEALNIIGHGGSVFSSSVFQLFFRDSCCLLLAIMPHSWAELDSQHRGGEAFSKSLSKTLILKFTTVK